MPIVLRLCAPCPSVVDCLLEGDDVWGVVPGWGDATVYYTANEWTIRVSVNTCSDRCVVTTDDALDEISPSLIDHDSVSYTICQAVDEPLPDGVFLTLQSCVGTAEGGIRKRKRKRTLCRSNRTYRLFVVAGTATPVMTRRLGGGNIRATVRFSASGVRLGEMLGGIEEWAGSHITVESMVTETVHDPHADRRGDMCLAVNNTDGTMRSLGKLEWRDRVYSGYGGHGNVIREYGGRVTASVPIAAMARLRKCLVMMHADDPYIPIEICISTCGVLEVHLQGESVLEGRRLHFVSKGEVKLSKI